MRNNGRCHSARSHARAQRRARRGTGDERPGRSCRATNGLYDLEGLLGTGGGRYVGRWEDEPPASRAHRLDHQFPEPGQPRPGEPTPSPPISFTSHNAHPDSGKTRSLLPPATVATTTCPQEALQVIQPGKAARVPGDDFLALRKGKGNTRPARRLRTRRGGSTRRLPRLSEREAGRLTRAASDRLSGRNIGRVSTIAAVWPGGCLRLEWLWPDCGRMNGSVSSGGGSCPVVGW